MTDTAIKVENLSKRYPSIQLRSLRTSRIGLEEEAPDTMAVPLLNFLNQPDRNLRRLSYPAGGQAALCYNLRKSLKECDDKTSYSTPLVAWRTEPK